MFIKSLDIKNFRCFAEDSEVKDIEFNVPDNKTRGSGLNIFVGENGTGKTTVLEAIDLVTKNPFSAKNRIQLSDFNHDATKIEVTAFTEGNFDVKRLWGTSSFQSRGFYFYAKHRDSRNSNDLLNPIVVDNEFMPVDESGIKPVEKRQAASGPYGGNRISDVNIFYFDKNRTRHLRPGMYSRTKFNDVIDDLNFQYLANIARKTDKERKQIGDKVDLVTEKIHSTLQDKVVNKALEKINDFFSSSDLRLDFVKILEPYSQSFFTFRKNKSLQQIPVANLGSGIETICAILFLDTVFGQQDGSIIYCIDEPELHLHPQAQRKLFRLLKDLSKMRQIFISTHSPYFVDPGLSDRIFRFSKNDSEEIEIFPKNKIGIKDQDKKSLTLDVQEIFFAKQVLCVEGRVDLDRLDKFLHQKGITLSDWSLIKMNSKEEAKKFYRILSTFSNKFKILLDLDALCGKQTDRAGIETETNTFKNLDTEIQDKVVSLGKERCEELTDGNLSEDEKKLKNEIISLLKEKNIFVLSQGEIEDYIDSNGVCDDSSKEGEILGLFD